MLWSEEDHEWPYFYSQATLGGDVHNKHEVIPYCIVIMGKYFGTTIFISVNLSTFFVAEYFCNFVYAIS